MLTRCLTSKHNPPELDLLMNFRFDYLRLSPTCNLNIFWSSHCTTSYNLPILTYPLTWNIFWTSDLTTSNHCFCHPHPTGLETFMENFNIAEISLCTGRLPPRLVSFYMSWSKQLNMSQYNLLYH